MPPSFCDNSVQGRRVPRDHQRGRAPRAGVQRLVARAGAAPKGGAAWTCARRGVDSRSAPQPPEGTSRRSQIGLRSTLDPPQTHPGSPMDHPQIEPRSTSEGPPVQMDPRSSPNRAQIGPNSTPNRRKIDPGLKLRELAQIWDRPRINPRFPQIDPESTPDRPRSDQELIPEIGPPPPEMDPRPLARPGGARAPKGGGDFRARPKPKRGREAHQQCAPQEGGTEDLAHAGASAPSMCLGPHMRVRISSSAPTPGRNEGVLCGYRALLREREGPHLVLGGAGGWCGRVWLGAAVGVGVEASGRGCGFLCRVPPLRHGVCLPRRAPPRPSVTTSRTSHRGACSSAPPPPTQRSSQQQQQRQIWRESGPHLEAKRPRQSQPRPHLPLIWQRWARIWQALAEVGRIRTSSG